jgi:hypothetical protein
MNESTILSVLCILAGIFGLITCIRLYTDKQFGENYIKKSPKALIWRKLFGEEKAYKLTKTIFAPIGLVLGSALIIIGLYLIYLTFIVNK